MPAAYCLLPAAYHPRRKHNPVTGRVTEKSRWFSPLPEASEGATNVRWLGDIWTRQPAKKRHSNTYVVLAQFSFFDLFFFGVPFRALDFFYFCRRPCWLSKPASLRSRLSVHYVQVISASTRAATLLLALPYWRCNALPC